MMTNLNSVSLFLDLCNIKLISQVTVSSVNRYVFQSFAFVGLNVYVFVLFCFFFASTNDPGPLMILRIF